MKACPYCAETIQDAAIKCRFCGSMLVDAPDPALSGAESASDRSAGRVPWTMLATAGVAIVAIGVLLGIYARLSRDPVASPGDAIGAASGSGAATASGSATASGTQSYVFSGLDWGTPAAEVDAQLAGRGFRFSEQDEEGDHVFSGTADGHDALVIAMLSDGTLAKIIEVLPAHGDSAGVYAQTVRGLSARFGEPSRRTPSSNGSRAVTEWPARPGVWGRTRLWTTVTDTQDVAVHYESAAWPAEAARRKTRRQAP